MRISLRTAALACLLLLAGPAAYAADGDAPRPSVLPDDRCGPKPMQPMDCLTGTWICRCRGSGQVCDWELVGCFTRPGDPAPGSTIRPDVEPTWPFPRSGGTR